MRDRGVNEHEQQTRLPDHSRILAVKCTSRLGPESALITAAFAFVRVLITHEIVH